MNVREIENIIDHVHENHPAFGQTRKQLIYELLSAFEDLCSLNVLGSILNPIALRKIVDQMDALNMALQWTQQMSLSNSAESIRIDISEDRYKQCVSLLNDYAYPYSVICSGYISFSRKRLTASVDGNIVTFNVAENQNNSVWSDILREASNSSLDVFLGNMNPIKLVKANAMLQRKVEIKEDMLYYELSDEVIEPFRETAILHWETSKALPESWKFDLFSLEEYKQFWISLATLCYIHFFACLKIVDPHIRMKNGTIIQNKESIVNYIMSMSGLEREKIEIIISYITFDPQKRNVDIMYQPIVEIEDDLLIIAPMLIMGSRPERNLLAVVSSKSDREYSKEVNDLEDLMVDDLEAVIDVGDNVQIVKHKNLGGRLPDVDFAILDQITNSALVCELKWFAAADSAKEVYAKEDEITHGCQQIESIMAYAMEDKKRFFKQVFNIEDGEDIDLFCCVVAKHNIRTQNKYVPVIDLKRLIELFSDKSLNSVFHVIRNHEYEMVLPEDASISYQEIEYGEYTFRIPAICFGSLINV